MGSPAEKRSFSKRIVLVGLGIEGLKSLEYINELNESFDHHTRSSIAYIYLDLASVRSSGGEQPDYSVFENKEFRKLTYLDGISELEANTPLLGKRFDSWIPSEVYMPNRPGLKRGSNLYARITFFLNFRKISKYFDSIFSEKGGEFLEVIVTGAIYNHAVGGILVDLIATIKKLALANYLENRFNINCTLLLPGPDQQNADNLARTYAALAEISRFSFSEEKFSVQFDENPSSMVQVDKPLLHELTLVRPKEIDLDNPKILAESVSSRYLFSEIELPLHSKVGEQVEQDVSFTVIGNNDDLRCLPTLAQYKSAFRKQIDDKDILFRTDIDRCTLSPLTSASDRNTPTTIRTLSKIEFDKNSFQITDIPLDQIEVDVIICPCDSRIRPIYAESITAKIISLAGNDVKQEISNELSKRPNGRAIKYIRTSGGKLLAGNIIFLPISDNGVLIKRRVLSENLSTILKKCQKEWTSIAIPWLGLDNNDYNEETELYAQEIYDVIKKHIEAYPNPRYVIFSSNSVSHIVPMVTCVERDKTILKLRKAANIALSTTRSNIGNYPFPIAKAFSDYLYAADWGNGQKMPSPILLFEQTLNHLRWISISEYLACSTKDKEIDASLEIELKRPITNGKIQSNIFKLLDHLKKNNNENNIFAPELLGLLDHQEPLRWLIEERNLVAHDGKELSKEFEPILFKMIDNLLWLSNYIMISPQIIDNSKMLYTCFNLAGPSPFFRKLVVKCDVNLLKNSVYLLDKRNKKTLALSPFYIIATCIGIGTDAKACVKCGKHPACGQDHLFMMSKWDSDGSAYEYVYSHIYQDKNSASPDELFNSDAQSQKRKQTANYLVIDEL